MNGPLATNSLRIQCENACIYLFQLTWEKAFPSAGVRKDWNELMTATFIRQPWEKGALQLH